jgi:7,8-dihydropterin-6-yl-methyl-4-(beta-D-ribofuranosyl)aminobenzene 5'-phosphate synthase
MIQTVAKHFPGDPIKGVVGGFHLMGMPPFGTGGPGKRAIAALGRELLAYPEARYYTGHCTGTKAFRVLRSVMGARVEPITTGSVLTL